ncbi:MAG: hypothetical protein K2X81_07885 [Candidatus Obscuribacterales bacterium]|nr:hypothetical protein [Candidatus Obscuribacterales bacterium]
MDLISKLHYSGKRFVHQHKIEQWGLSFWVTPNYSTLAGMPCEGNPKAYADLSMEESLHYTKCKDLQDIEQEWKFKNNENCDYKDNDEFWRKHWNEIKHTCELEDEAFVEEAKEEEEEEGTEAKEFNVEYDDDIEESKTNLLVIK